MKKINLIVILMLLCTQSFAQDIKTSDEFTVKAGTPYKLLDGYKRYFSKDGNVIAIKTRKDKLCIQKFDADKATQESVNEYDDYPDNYIVIGEIETANKLYHIYAEETRKSDSKDVYAREISYESGSFIGKGIKIFTIEEKFKGYISMETSFDEKNILFQYRLAPEKRNDKVNKDKIGMHVFTEELEELWSSTVQMPYTEAMMNNISYAVDKEGTVHILTEVFKDKSRTKYDKNGNAKFDYKIVSIKSDDVEENSAEIELKKKKITQIGFFEGAQGELLLAGFYSNKSEYNCDGLFVVKLDKDGSLIDFKTFEISLDIIKQNTSDRAQKKMSKADDKGKDLSLSNMILREILHQADGSTIFIAEKHFVVTTTDSKGNSHTTTYYQEILATKINKDGELSWMKKIPKNQIGGGRVAPSISFGMLTIGFGGSVSKGGMGYKYIGNDESHYFFFLDNIKNLNLPNNEYPKAYADGSGGYLTAVKIDNESGATEKLSLFNLKKVDGLKLYQFQVDRIIDVAKNQMLVECKMKKKEDVLIKIDINE